MQTPPSILDSFATRDWRARFWSFVASDWSSAQVSTRIPSIDSFRVLAIFAVILWHSHFVSSLSQSTDGNFFVVLNGYLIWWVGVPYFFITAGYFYERSVRTMRNPTKQLLRYVTPLAWILVIWVCIYIVTPPAWPSEVRHHGLWQSVHTEMLKNIQLMEHEHVWLFIRGAPPVWHLWFLPALMFSLGILTLVVMSKLQKYLPFLVIGIYLLILVEESTSRNLLNAPTPLGQWLVAILFVAMGSWLAWRREPFSANVGWSLILLGYVFALVEGAVMNMVFHSSLPAIREHVFLGGVLFSLGIFLLVLAKPQMGRSTPFPRLGQLTLGIYVAHVFVMYTITPFVWNLPDKVPMWGLFLGIIVYLTSAMFVLVLTRVPIMRYLVLRSG